MEEEYECGYCGNLLGEDYDDVIFIDRAFMPSGDVFCNEECLLHFLEAYRGTFKDIKALIDADDNYLPTIPHKFTGGDRTAACMAVQGEANGNSAIYQY
ncbi:MAG: hypothetical protein K5983_08765 [Lactobacillus sp.]|nr:hypothetical protein [Lactobacillus sp.]